MKAQDRLTEQYSPILDGYYNCTDRLVINAYCPLLQRGAGLRYWWRLFKGDDKSLDTNQLMRRAGVMSKRVQSWCRKNNIPLEYFKAGERKQNRAQELMPLNGNFEGIFAVFAGTASEKLWEVKRFSNGMDIKKKENYSFVRHYYFHILDKEWGHIMIRMCAHPPYKTLITLNGHEWVARRPEVMESEVEKTGNCFTKYPDGELLTRHAETLSTQGRLEGLCDKWMSKCLWFAVSDKEQQKCPLYFKYSIYQIEYSRNLLFKRGCFLDQAYQGIIDSTRSKLDIQRLKTIVGRKRRPKIRVKNKKSGRRPVEVNLETPNYNLTVFKIHFGKLTVKLYDKGERTLRAEVVVHNAKALKCRRSLEYFQNIMVELESIMNSFLDNLSSLHVALIGDVDLASIASPVQKGNNRLAGVNINHPRMQAVLETVLALSLKPEGYSSKDVAVRMSDIGWEKYDARKAAYDLRKLRGKGLVRKLNGTRRYIHTDFGIHVIIALLSLARVEFSKTIAILKNDAAVSNQRLSKIEAQHFVLDKEIRNLRSLYNIYEVAV